MNRDSQYPFVSVIVPTYNRAESLCRTIRSLMVQQYPQAYYEVVVVNNNSNDDTLQHLAVLKDQFGERITILNELRQGVHYARNLGAHYARGEILYFTDDDMYVHERALLEIVRGFSLSDSVGCVTGRVVPRWEAPPPQWVLRYCHNQWLSLLNRAEDIVLASFDIGVYSCHQGIRREVLFEAGGFNPENTAGEWIGDGETGLNAEVQRLGYKFAFVGAAVTEHVIPPSRLTQKYLNRRLGNQGNCDSYTWYRRRRPIPRTLLRSIMVHSLRAIIRLARIPIRMCMFDGSWRVELAFVSYYVQRAKYETRLVCDKKWRLLVMRRRWIDECCKGVAEPEDVHAHGCKEGVRYSAVVDGVE